MTKYGKLRVKKNTQNKSSLKAKGNSHKNPPENNKSGEDKQKNTGPAENLRVKGKSLLAHQGNDALKAGEGPLKANEAISSRSLVEAAMMVALSVLLGIIGRYVPFLNIFGVLIFPLPTVVLVLRRGFRAGLIGAVSTAILLALIMNPLVALIMLIQYLFLGLFFGYAFRMGFKPITTMIIGTIISSIGTIFNLLLSTYIAGLPLEAIYAQMGEVASVFVDTLEKTGGANLDKILPAGMTIAEYKIYLLDFMQTMLPGALIAAAMGLTAISYLIFDAVLRRLNYRIPSLPKFRDWRLDWRMVSGVILALLLNFIGNRYENPALVQIGGNILYMYYFLLLIFGLAFIVWLLKNWQAERFVKVFAIIILLMFAVNNIGVFIIMLIGLFDPLLDFRRLILPIIKK